MKVTSIKPDVFGAFASTLCLLHCIATPLLFIVQSCSLKGCHSTPTWWKTIDYIFLVISFFAIYHSTQTTTSKVIKPMLWLSWFLLFFVVINEKLSLIFLPEYAIYIPALALVILHIYNLNYCQCKTEKCCVHHE
ncbi:membrane protein [Tenacibaculum holothuriorum]|uniref:Membrane protein n=1 Tax=Tenacibaculum holothuriorum TaxID=1635173 RepID=A0A1Y2PGI9_9FLAO|nr:MerC domain-containing protein [Tenacibaculum holothuriorum]OSY89270.1 membrane protein [Tenacibaculum holothuriorum]